MIIDDHWLDFYVNDVENLEVNIIKINDYKVEVTVSGVGDLENIQFNSIGDLNVVVETYTFNLISADAEYSSVVFSNYTSNYYVNISSNTSILPLYFHGLQPFCILLQLFES